MNAPKSHYLTPDLERLRPMSMPNHVDRDLEESHTEQSFVIFKLKGYKLQISAY